MDINGSPIRRNPTAVATLPSVDRDGAAAFLVRCHDAEPTAPSTLGLDTGAELLTQLQLPSLAPVLLALPTGKLLLELYLGTLLAGLTPLITPHDMPPPELERLAGLTGARAVACQQGPGQRRRPPGPTIDLHRLRAVAPPVSLHPDRRGHAQPTIVLTSGAGTGLTACVHDVRLMLRGASRFARAIGLSQDDVVQVHLPMAHPFTLMTQIWAAYSVGATLVISSPRPYGCGEYERAIIDHRATCSAVGAGFARYLLSRSWPLPRSLRAMVLGGARLADSEVSALVAANPSIEIYTTYGLAEAGSQVSVLAAHEEPSDRHGSVGRPLDGVSVSLYGVSRDDTCGELLVRAPTIASEKLGTPSRHLRVGPSTIRTGDKFHIDNEYLYFLGRLSEQPEEGLDQPRSNLGRTENRSNHTLQAHP